MGNNKSNIVEQMRRDEQNGLLQINSVSDNNNFDKIVKKGSEYESITTIAVNKCHIFRAIGHCAGCVQQTDSTPVWYCKCDSFLDNRLGTHIFCCHHNL